jgi:hypothetical protein
MLFGQIQYVISVGFKVFDRVIVVVVIIFVLLTIICNGINLQYFLSSLHNPKSEWYPNLGYYNSRVKIILDALRSLWILPIINYYIHCSIIYKHRRITGISKSNISKMIITYIIYCTSK